MKTALLCGSGNVFSEIAADIAADIERHGAIGQVARMAGTDGRERNA